MVGLFGPTSDGADRDYFQTWKNHALSGIVGTKIEKNLHHSGNRIGTYGEILATKFRMIPGPQQDPAPTNRPEGPQATPRPNH